MHMPYKTTLDEGCMPNHSILGIRSQQRRRNSAIIFISYLEHGLLLELSLIELRLDWVRHGEDVAAAR
jgi:hypothetical protein